MNKYLVELKHPTSGDMLLVQLEGETSREVYECAVEANPGWEVVKIKSPHGGKRSGAGRVSKWNEKTKVYRLPPSVGDKVEEIVGELDMVNGILESWESKVNESKSKSASGVPSERYKHVAQLVNDLRTAMKVTGEKLVP